MKFGTKAWAYPLVGGGVAAAALVVGGVIGWRLRDGRGDSVSVAATKPPIVSASGLAASSGDKLDLATAQRLLDAHAEGFPNAACWWNSVHRATSTRWGYLDFDESGACARTLAAEGYVTIGACLRPGCTSGCCSREIAATGSNARFERDALLIKCGKIKQLRALSVATTGNTATVHFYREQALDEDALRKIEVCRLDIPKTPAEGDFAARRDDNGLWTLIQ